MLNVLLCVAPLFLFSAIGIWGYTSEKKEWNNGKCKENGLSWSKFDNDSQGGRGYVAGNQYCWISWPGIDT